MDITWLGHAAIRMRTRDATVVMDPTDKSGGLDMGRPTGDIVTISHHHPHHDYASGVKGSVMVLDGPGEYEIRGVQIEGLRASLRPSEDAETAQLRSTIFIFDSEELRLAHLGGLGVVPTGQQAEHAEHLANLDVIFVPIGCPEALTPQDAARVTRMLEPRVVIPIAYDPSPGGTPDALESFVKDIGSSPEEPVARLSLQRRNVGGDQLRIVLLESRG